MTKRNEPGCSASSLSGSLASGTRLTTVSSDGEDIEDSGEDASESVCFVFLCENLLLWFKKIILLRSMAYFWSIMANILTPNDNSYSTGSQYSTVGRGHSINCKQNP